MPNWNPDQRDPGRRGTRRDDRWSGDEPRRDRRQAGRSGQEDDWTDRQREARASYGDRDGEGYRGDPSRGGREDPARDSYERSSPGTYRGVRGPRDYGDWGRPYDASTATRTFERPGETRGGVGWPDFAGMSHRGKGPKGFTRSDERLREEVCERLMDDDEVDASEIEVSVKEAEVTLDGHVDSRPAKRRAEDCAERVAGVRHVQNNLRVQPQSGVSRDMGAE